MIFLTIDLVHVNVKNFEALKSSNEMERKDDYRVKAIHPAGCDASHDVYTAAVIINL